MRGRRGHRGAPLVRLLVLVLGCSNGTGGEPPPACADTAGTYAIEQRQVDHACLHTKAGPFAFVQTGLAPEPLPELRHTHTAYTLRLVDTPGGYRGAARVKPSQPSVFAFYSQPDLDMTVREQGQDLAGPGICAVARGAVGGCARLAAVRAFPLVAGREYVLGFGPVSASTVLVVVEAETAAPAVDAGPP